MLPPVTGQPQAARAAARIWSVTGCGCEMSVRCEPPGTVRIFACARLAIAVCDAGTMILSAPPMTYHDGIVCQAALAERVVKAVIAAGRCPAHSMVACGRGRSGPNDCRKTGCLRYNLVSPSAAPGGRTW